MNIERDPIRRIPFAIANGASVSDDHELMGGVIVGIVTPASFTSTTIKFDQYIPDKDYPNTGVWVPVYDEDGSEVSITVSTSRFTAVNPVSVPCAGRTRIRTGSAEGGARTVILVTRQLG